jgi:hypothetical protein
MLGGSGMAGVGLGEKYRVKCFEQPVNTRPFTGKGMSDGVAVGGRSVARDTFEPGWRWSVHRESAMRIDSCDLYDANLHGPHECLEPCQYRRVGREPEGHADVGTHGFTKTTGPGGR